MKKRLINFAVLLAMILSLGYTQPAAAVGPETWYVSSTAGNDSNTCNTVGTPCLTINAAINQSADGDTVKVAVGTYTASSGTEVVLINKGITLSGGWDETFTTQNGMSTIDGGAARWGILISGGIVSSITNFMITNSTFGILGSNSGGMVDVSQSAIVNNTGNGLYNYSGDINFINVTFSGNHSSGYAGVAISNVNGTVDLKYSTVSGNFVPNNHGVIWSGGMGGITKISNSIVAQNNNGECGSSSWVISNGNNIFDSYCSQNIALHNTDEVAVDPKLSFLQNNGGGTLTFALFTNSPAVDAGSVDFCPPVDQRGVARPVGSACDIGAYEGSVPGVDDFVTLNPNPSSLAEVNFQITFTESVSGVDETDFAVNSAGVSGASITAVNGSGTTYTVTVNTGTWASNAKLGLNLADDDTIKNVSLVPLGGDGNDNGDFSSEEYTLIGPAVSSIALKSSSPTALSSVIYQVTFTESVTGVDVTDFALTPNGVSGASVTSVSGSGAVYTVTVNTGTWSENATLRLDVLDDDTIVNGSSIPLGGTGLGNGAYTSGPAYTFSAKPTLLAPIIPTTDTTPTFKWSKIGGATQYQLQVYKGKKLAYSKTIDAAKCTTSACANTPGTALGYGAYKWRVRAKVGEAWKEYSNFQNFAVSPAKAGYWQGKGAAFYVLNSTPKVSYFSVAIYVNGCGGYVVTRKTPINLTSKTFSFKGAFTATGAFTKTTAAKGTVSFSNYLISGCGYVSGGPLSWSATWKNTSQPKLLIGDMDIFVTPSTNGFDDPIILEVQK